MAPFLLTAACNSYCNWFLALVTGDHVGQFTEGTEPVLFD